MATMKERQREVQLYRGQIPSPGRPTVAWREDRVRFWAVIALGEKTDDAAAAAGVSSPVGYRWFRHAGGVNPCLPATVSGRYLSFSEREDIALYRAQGLGVREIARRLDRSPSTIARATPERIDTHVPARVQGDDRAMARRAARPAPEGCQARRPRPPPGLRPGPALWPGSGSGWSGPGPGGPGVERQEQASSW
jgi:Helix-turn-helix domain